MDVGTEAFTFVATVQVPVSAAVVAKQRSLTTSAETDCLAKPVPAPEPLGTEDVPPNPHGKSNFHVTFSYIRVSKF